MERKRWPEPGLDLFWEEADVAEDGGHPLERELAHRCSVLRRYERLIGDAAEAGREDELRCLQAQHGYQLQLIAELTAAMRGRGYDFH